MKYFMNSETNNKKGSSQYAFVEHIKPCDHLTPLCATGMKYVNLFNRLQNKINVNLRALCLIRKKVLRTKTVLFNLNCWRT